MNDYIAVIVLAATVLFVLNIFVLARSIRHWRERAFDAEATVSMQKTEIMYLSDENDRLKGLIGHMDRRTNAPTRTDS